MNRQYNDCNTSTANKYYSSVDHHEQKNKRTTGQIKFLAVTINQGKKINDIAVAQFHLQYFLCSQKMYKLRQSVEVFL